MTRQDPGFGIQQIVDVAVKALSPSENDPTTAVTAIHYLGALLVEFASSPQPSPFRGDEHGTLRLIAAIPTFRSMADLALDQPREHAGGERAVVLALLDTIIRVAAVVEAEDDRAVLQAHVWKVARAADAGIRDPADRAEINERLRLAMASLGKEETGAQHYLLDPRAPT